MNGTPLTPRLAGALAAALLLAACATAVPVVPYPDVVQAPHPLGLAEAADAEAVLETYSASPNRNPDGLGTLDALWLNSRMTLVPWPVARAREAANRLAYARTAEEHERVLAEARALYAQHWVFEGLLLSDVPAAAQVDFYLPDGVYLVDDRGRRFRPQVARNADPLTTARAVSRFGEAHYGGDHGGDARGVPVLRGAEPAPALHVGLRPHLRAAARPRAGQRKGDESVVSGEISAWRRRSGHAAAGRH